MPESDPVTWKLIAGGAITALAAPILYVARKAVGAASREELAEAMAETKATHNALSNKVSAVRSDIFDFKADITKMLTDHILEENENLETLPRRTLEEVRKHFDLHPKDKLP